MLLTAPLTNECAEANWVTISDELMSSLSVAPVFVNVAVEVLLEEPKWVEGAKSCRLWVANWNVFN